MAVRFVEKYYADTPDVVLDGYGFVCNPPGSRTQAWHLDYSAD